MTLACSKINFICDFCSLVSHFGVRLFSRALLAAFFSKILGVFLRAHLRAVSLRRRADEALMLRYFSGSFARLSF
jgi:hypothetical protein